MHAELLGRVLGWGRLSRGSTYHATLSPCLKPPPAPPRPASPAGRPPIIWESPRLGSSRAGPGQGSLCERPGPGGQVLTGRHPARTLKAALRDHPEPWGTATTGDPLSASGDTVLRHSGEGWALPC